MFAKTPKELYNEYHDATNDTARQYWYQCLQTRLQTGIDREKCQYYLNIIDTAAQAVTEVQGGWTGAVTPQSLDMIKTSLR